MMLAMAHGSNEINVSAPLLAEIFLLDGNTKEVKSSQEYISIVIGLISMKRNKI